MQCNQSSVQIAAISCRMKSFTLPWDKMNWAATQKTYHAVLVKMAQAGWTHQNLLGPEGSPTLPRAAFQLPGPSAAPHQGLQQNQAPALIYNTWSSPVLACYYPPEKGIHCLRLMPVTLFLAEVVGQLWLWCSSLLPPVGAPSDPHQYQPYTTKLHLWLIKDMQI